MLEKVISPNQQYITLVYFGDFSLNTTQSKKYNFCFNDMQYLLDVYLGIVKVYKITTKKHFEETRVLVNDFISTERLIPRSKLVPYDTFISLWIVYAFWTMSASLTEEETYINIELIKPIDTLCICYYPT